MLRLSSGHVVLSLLQQFTVPRTVIHVGAGSGTGLLHLWQQWSLDQAVLIDAGLERMSWVEKEAAGRPWHAAAACIGSSQGKGVFFQATNPDESGLIHPEKLTALWPNLRCAGQVPLDVERLDGFLAKMPHVRSQGPTWLLVDCFPALDIIRSAGEEIRQCSVIVARVLTTEQTGDLIAASLPAVVDFLVQEGLRLVHVEQGNHPATAHAVFVRDWPRDVLAVRQAYTEQTGRLNELQTAVDALIKEKEEIAKARDERANEVVELQAQIKTLHQEKDNLKIRIGDRDSRTAAELKTALESQGQQWEGFSGEADRNGRYLQILQDELLRAEGQIELIKDLLLRERE